MSSPYPSYGGRPSPSPVYHPGYIGGGGLGYDNRGDPYRGGTPGPGPGYGSPYGGSSVPPGPGYGSPYPPSEPGGYVGGGYSGGGAYGAYGGPPLNVNSGSFGGEGGGGGSPMPPPQTVYAEQQQLKAATTSSSGPVYGLPAPGGYGASSYGVPPPNANWATPGENTFAATVDGSGMGTEQGVGAPGPVWNTPGEIIYMYEIKDGET